MAAVADLTRGPVLLGVSISTAFIAISSSALRFFVRARTGEEIGLDDCAIGLATIVGFIGTIFSILESSASIAGSSMRALKFDVLGQPWFVMGGTLAKISICLLFIRLVGRVRTWRFVLMGLILGLALVNFSVAMAMDLQCRPLDRLWNMGKEGECWDPSVQLNIGYFRGAFSMISWLFLSLFPVVIARDLEIDRSVRRSFYALSSLCLVSGVFAATRTYETSQIPHRSGVFSYANFVSTLLSILEQNIGILAANALTMGPLLCGRQRRAADGDGTNGSATLFSKGDSVGSSKGSSHSVRRFWRRRFGGSDDQAGSGGNKPRRPFARLKDSPSTTTLVTAGRGRESFELAPAAGRLDRSDSRRSNRSNFSVTTADDASLKGIIKTIEVKVVEEDIADVERAIMGSLAGGEVGAPGNEWDRAMRQGPAQGRS